MNSILLAVGIVAGIGLLIGLILSIASIIMAVPKDEKAEAILEALPGANCGACGFSGCSGYADALAKGKAEPGLCAPGGLNCTKAISEILGVETGNVEPKVAVVKCMGSLDHTTYKAEYSGIMSCAAAMKIGGGLTACSYGCMGLGDCEAACPYDAIHVNNGAAYVDGGNLHEIPREELKDKLTNSNTAQQNRDTLEKWLIQQPLDFEPDSMYSYCNSNFFLLARIVEKVSKTPFEQFVKERIFTPLGMTHSGFIDEMLGSEDLAENPNPNPQTVYVGITMGLGDMISNAADMNLWLTSFFDNKLLSPESYAAMTTNYSTPEDGGTYGFGVQPANGGFFHWGYFTSYCAYDYTEPGSKYTFFAVSNDSFNAKGEMSEMCNILASATYN